MFRIFVVIVGVSASVDTEKIIWEPKIQTALPYNAMKFHQPSCRKSMYDLLETAVYWLNEANVTWWLDYGLLLGSLRHAAINPCDYDGDLGVLFENDDQYTRYSKFIRSKIDSHPQMKYWMGHSYPHTIILIDTVSKVHLDLFTFRSINPLTFVHLNRQPFYHERKDLFPLQMCKLSRMVIPCPASPINILAKKYNNSRLFGANGCKDKQKRQELFPEQFSAMTRLRVEGFPSLLDAFPETTYPEAAHIRFKSDIDYTSP